MEPKLGLVAPFPAEKVQKVPWTAEGLLTEFIADVQAGKIKPESLMVFYIEEDADGRLRPHYWTQGVSIQQQIAYGLLIQKMALDDWAS